MSLTPAKFNLVIWEAATWRKRITVLTGGTGSSPFDLTGYTGAMNFRLVADATPVYSLTTSNGGITLGGAAGTIDLFISNTDTLTFDTWNTALYELFVTAPDSDVLVLLWGGISTRGLS